MPDKYNAYKKAQEEVSKPNPPATVTNTITGDIIPNKKRETKQQMSIMLTPTHKKKLRKLADSLDMSASELIGYWIDQHED
ncbi:hypothetical protein [Sporosarcina sp. BP05]|uniref:hypothetical protein n=1 Tax=Sporosarcina sp. BP05 TaxID=2758726 RepID=UPI00164480D2|nr:hypothetical protein [Sporosarcina sp. BP05]